MDIYLLGSIFVAIVGILIGLLFLKGRHPGGGQEHPEPSNQILPGARRRPIPGRARRRQQPSDDGDEDNEAEASTSNIDLPEGKIGAKKLAKLQAKAERKAQRETEEKERAEKKKKQEAAEEARKKTEEFEKVIEKQKEEEEKKLLEEKEKKEYEEYLKLKAEFSVEEEGFEEDKDDGKNSIHDFVNYIKSSKVVVLEDLAAHFSLKTQQVIDRIQQLQTDGILSGVIDDRGKFIYISQEELEAVAKFVKQRGRVSITELVENSNLLIDLSPTLSV